MSRSRALPLAALALFLAPLVPELVGARLIVFRDAFITHFPIQTSSAAIERAGGVPFLNTGASNVEPLLANPNTVTLYPTHLLFHVLPAAAAFNLHLLLHVVFAFFGAAALCRRFGSGRDAAWIGGAAYAFSGPFLSYGSAFANAAAAAAWAPWAVSEAIRLGRAVGTVSGRAARPMLALGTALGLQILAGEPAISAWTIVAVVAASLVAARRRIVALALRGAGAALLGLLLAAPQILPTAAAIPESFRGRHLFSREQFNAAANVPIRALETLLPLVFGAPRPIASGAFWAYRPFDSLQPYLYSMNVGLAAVVLVAAAFAVPTFRRSRVVQGLVAAAALFGILSLGFRTPVFEVLYSMKFLRHFRYPIKFALPATLALAVLVSLASRRWIGEEVRKRTRLAAALAAAALLGTAAAATGTILRWADSSMRGLALPAGAVVPGISRTIALDVVFGFLAAALLFAAALSPRGPRAPILLASVLLSLLPSGWRLFVSTPAAPYVARPELASVVAGRGRVWVGPIEEFAVAKLGTSHRFLNDDVTEMIFAGRQELWPLTGLPDDVSYTFDNDPDGSYAFLDRAMREDLASQTPEGKARLLRNASTAFYLSARPEPLPGFRPLAAQDVLGRRVFLFQAISPVPLVRCASRISSRKNPIALIDSTAFDPAREAVVFGPDADPPAATPEGAPPRVSAIRVTPAGFSAEVDAAGRSMVVFAANYFRFWRAFVDGAPAEIEIADGAFCGVRVGSGRHRVELRYDRWPFLAGSAGAGLFLIVAVMVVGTSSRAPKPPFPPDPES